MAKSESRRVLIVGCGAIGGIFAASFARAADVVGYDTNAEHVQAIRDRSLRVLREGREASSRIAATADAASLAGQRFDAILFLTKSKATGAALAALRPVLANRPPLITLQNGMGNSDVLLAVEACPVARGVTMAAGRYLGPGAVEHLLHGKTWLGPLRGTVEDLRWFGALCTAADLPTEIIPDPMGAVWAKFLFNSVMNPIGALLLGVNAARYESPEVLQLIDEMAAEGERVIRALGGSFAFDPMEYVNKVRAGEAPLSKHAGSMALDIARGAPTEIDELTGYIVAEGERLGIAVPASKTVYRLVKGLEIAASHKRSGGT
ncbi:MAG TPA: 2-dehydropantoate 2-reductase [Alphaproteobacteria bacterium]